MIKLNRLPEEVMDVVMDVARYYNKQPSEVVKIMLGLVGKNEAMKAVNNEQNLQGTK